jgi:hypothetical protein
MGLCYGRILIITMYFSSLAYHLLFLLLHVRIKSFLSLRTTQRRHGGVKVKIHTFLILALDGCLTPEEMSAVTIGQEAGRILGPVWVQ